MQNLSIGGIELAGKNNTKVRIPKSLIPKPKQIAKRGLYELMWGGPHRDYGKRLKRGRY